MIGPEIKVDLKDLEALTKQFPEASKKARISRITEACKLLEGRVKLQTPQGAGANGYYRDSIFSKVEFGQKLEYGVSVWGTIGSPRSYGEVLEYGRRPGKVPKREPEEKNPILFWVKKKLGYSGKEAKKVAFLISRSISKHGTKGAHMYEKAFKENESLVTAMLNQIPDDIVNMLKK